MPSRKTKWQGKTGETVETLVPCVGRKIETSAAGFLFGTPEFGLCPAGTLAVLCTEDLDDACRLYLEAVLCDETGTKFLFEIEASPSDFAPLQQGFVS